MQMAILNLGKIILRRTVGGVACPIRDGLLKVMVYTGLVAAVNQEERKQGYVIAAWVAEAGTKWQKYREQLKKLTKMKSMLPNLCFIRHQAQTERIMTIFITCYLE